MKKILCLLVVGVLALRPGGLVHADDGSSGDRVVIGQNFTLQTGETVDGDVVVVGGQASIQTGATVRGDLVVIGGSLQMDGEVGGSAIVIGGSVLLGSASIVGNDMVALGGAFQRGDGSRIGGDLITNLSIAREGGRGRSVLPFPAFPPRAGIALDFGPLTTLTFIFLQALVLGAVGMLLAAFLHPQLDRVGQVARAQPFAAGSFGLLTVLAAPLAITLMAITFILIPLALAAALLVALAGLFGMIALGQLVGEQLMNSLHRRWDAVLTAGLGAFVLGLGLGAVNQIPCIGPLASVLVGLLGLGAVAMTMFGTRIPPRQLSTTSPSAPRDSGSDPSAPMSS
jgi:hypothetical protein